MTTAPLREPTTPEEIEIFRKRQAILTFLGVITAGFYGGMLLIVPEVPNSPFYVVLDTFLNDYLFGDMMPEFSSNFHFAMKATWCLSLLYSLCAFFMLLLAIHIRLKPSGARVVVNMYRNGMSITAERYITLLIILAAFGCIYFSIALYAFFTDPALTFMRVLEERFYGNFFSSSLLFLFLHVFLLRYLMLTLALNFYYVFFCRGE